MENLPKLVEDIVQTSINTGPRGALRLAQGIQAVIGVGGEWLTELSQVYSIFSFQFYFKSYILFHTCNLIAHLHLQLNESL